MEKCTICQLEEKPRKLGEGLLKMRVPLRDMERIIEFYINMDLAEKVKTPSRASWDRHKREGHFQMEDKASITMGGQPVLDLDDFVDQLWMDFQSANRGKAPDENRLMKWIELRAKVRNDMKSREEEKRMREAIQGAAPGAEDAV